LTFLFKKLYHLNRNITLCFSLPLDVDHRIKNPGHIAHIMRSFLHWAFYVLQHCAAILKNAKFSTLSVTDIPTAAYNIFIYIIVVTCVLYSTRTPLKHQTYIHICYHFIICSVEIKGRVQGVSYIILKITSKGCIRAYTHILYIKVDSARHLVPSFLTTFHKPYLVY